VDIRVFPYKRSGSKSIVFVSCSAESGQCTHSAVIGEAFLAKLGISSIVVQSNYTPAGNQQVSTALSMKPNAIIALAIAPSTIGAQIAQAKSQFIRIIDGYGTEPIDGGNLSGYVPQGSSLYQIAAATEMIVASGGKGSILWLSAAELPELEIDVGISFLKSTCSTCHLVTGSVTAAQVTSPVSTGAVVTSSVQANDGRRRCSWTAPPSALRTPFMRSVNETCHWPRRRTRRMVPRSRRPTGRHRASRGAILRPPGPRADKMNTGNESGHRVHQRDRLSRWGVPRAGQTGRAARSESLREPRRITAAGPRLLDREGLTSRHGCVLPPTSAWAGRRPAGAVSTRTRRIRGEAGVR
jgi:hypothetical protein